MFQTTIKIILNKVNYRNLITNVYLSKQIIGTDYLLPLNEKYGEFSDEY